MVASIIAVSAGEAITESVRPMTTSEKIDQIAPAFVKAQALIEGATKDAKGNYGLYATLASVVDACKQHLNENGIGFVQTFEPSEPDRLAMTTTLLHVSGQFMSGTITMKLPRPDPQGYGSAATYARRYSLAAMVGVAPEDDDGTAAGRADHPQARPVAKQASTPTKPSPDVLADADEFRIALGEAYLAQNFTVEQSDAATKAVLAKHKVKSVDDLSLTKRHEFIAAIAGGKLDKFKTSIAS